MHLEAGALVNDNVRLLHLLAEGGMGSVWVAEHLTLKTQVAVKFISAEFAETNPAAVARFNREATAAAQIKSPHVVQTLDHGVTDEGAPYIVMELLEGEDLGQRLERLRTLPPHEIAEILAQVAKALARAHAAGIVHRDIKPDNVFLLASDDDELFVKVLDFGVAKRTGVDRYTMVTATGSMVGTPGYMSPEQVLHGHDIDHRSDLWSLGVLAYHALTGDIPFAGETVGALCIAITRGNVMPPSHLRPGLPTTVDAWMVRALALDREERFTSAKEMAESFAAAIDVSGATTERPPPPPNVDERPPRDEPQLSTAELVAELPRARPPALWAALAGAVLVAAVAASFALTGVGRTTAAPAATAELPAEGPRVVPRHFPDARGDSTTARAIPIVTSEVAPSETVRAAPPPAGRPTARASAVAPPPVAPPPPSKDRYGF